MTLSKSYLVIPSERPPFIYPFIVKDAIDENIQYIYDTFLNTETRLKVGRAIKMNKPILLFQDVKKLTKRAPTKPKEYYKAPDSSEIISDEEFIEKYRHYLDVPKIDHNPVYLNNRMGILDSVSKMMEGIPIVDDTSSCGKTTDNFQRMTHQEIVRRYINSYSPYRGLLLFHGLGSGKTCSSISLIEGLMDSKKVIIMTPASLQSNYRTQMKFCGDHLFRKQNNWVFERFKKEGAEISKEYLEKKRSALDLLQLESSPTLDKFIEEINGMWMVSKSGEPNFDTLHIKEKEEIDRQLSLLIKEKYTYINYNSNSISTWKNEYKRKGINPFDNATVIVDEAHNFVSRIVNKINKKKTSVSVDLYEDMMSAENCRIILLTGTPFINYPYELGALFNLIHGYTFILEIDIQPKKETHKEYFEELFLKEGIVDIIDYNETRKILKITQNPYGFLKQPDGRVAYSKEKRLYYSEFVDSVTNLLKSKSDQFTIGEVKHTKVKHLPDNQKDFDHYFLSEKASEETDPKLKLFQLRIVGLVSYLGDKTNLMPSIIKSEDGQKIHLEKTVMSPYQVGYYAETRKIERKQETNQKKSKKKNEEEASTYRIFSRSACNFVFPPDINRPMPSEYSEVSKIDEAMLDAETEEEMMTDIDGKYDTSDLEILRKNKEKVARYQNAIKESLIKFETTPEEYFESGLPKLVKINHPDKENRLEKYSPKFKKMLTNIITQPDCHLVYSNFKKLEGIGIFRLALMYHGYKELKIVKNRIVINSMFKSTDYIEDKTDHRYFSLFTGGEKAEEREIILNIYNNRFKNLPKVTQDDLKQHFGHVDLEKDGNMYGEIIKVLMITASGAEGIDLKNTRFVHIMEPYWHHVRINQVIGRARRICSHMDLPKELQDVTVYMYISIFGDDVLKTEQYTDLKLLDNAESTDMRLYGIMEGKEKLSERFLDVLKRTSIDCAVNHRKKCFTFPKTTPTRLFTTTDYHDAASVKKPV